MLLYPNGSEGEYGEATPSSLGYRAIPVVLALYGYCTIGNPLLGPRELCAKPALT